SGVLQEALLTCILCLCCIAGISNASLTISVAASGDLDPSWDGTSLTTMDGTPGGTTGTTTDWHIFGTAGVTPTDTKLDGSGIGALAFNANASGNTLTDQPLSGAQPDVTWTDGTTVTTPPALVESFLQSAGEGVGETFTISLAASEELSTAYLVLGVLRSAGTLTATMSDASETDTAPAYSTGLNKAIIYKIEYSSPTATTLDFTWEKTADASGDSGIRFQAVTLNTIPEPTTLGMIAMFGGGILFVRRKMMM
ncbi:MAG: PEP-CTERM sorting domain-containing protein, partial [Verrucomicrobia bacterium]|nr:PEP-CTERM sorting domain-containing protein [Verrucomicrobiota bacterium]